MSERAGKLSLVLSVVTLLLMGFLTYRSFAPLAFVANEYNPTSDQVTTDLLGKSVGLPQGQIWGFNPDQALTVKKVGKRQLDVDTVVVTVDVNAVVKFPQPGANDKKPGPSDPPQPKKATLSGLAKVYYERHQGQWYCISVDGISLKVVAE
jgi:hypothetical protein